MSACKPLAAFAAVASVVFAPAILAEDDAAALRAELQSLKSEYDARVAALPPPVHPRSILRSR
jgi:hypothetical protein